MKMHVNEDKDDKVPRILKMGMDYCEDPARKNVHPFVLKKLRKIKQPLKPHRL
jgi:hypothetical protein